MKLFIKTNQESIFSNRKITVSKIDNEVLCSIAYKNSDTERVEPHECKINIDDLYLREDIADCTVYALTNKQNVFNVYAETLPTRKSSHAFFNEKNESMTLAVVIPSIEDKQSASILIFCGSGDEVLVTGDLQNEGESSGFKSLLPSLEISNQQISNNILSFDISSTSLPDHDVYIDTSIGAAITSKTRIKNGFGRGYISLSGLPSGLTGKIKLSFKFYSSVCTTEFTS